MRWKKRKTRPTKWRWGLKIVGAAMAFWLLSQALPPRSSAGVPGPLGGPGISQDVNTKVGQKAAAFSLPDAEGVRHAVVPGRGRPMVVISHMGFY